MTKGIHWLAHILSWIFHPLFIITYGLLMLLIVNPFAFGVHTFTDKKVLLLTVFMQTFLLPLVGLLMMRFTGLVSSVSLEHSKERIGPYIITGVFFLWMFANIRLNPEIPLHFKSFVLGATMSLFVAFFINNFSKISLHTVGMGGLIGLVLLVLISYYQGTILVHAGDWYVRFHTLHLVLLVIISAGLVGTARLLLQAHLPGEVYGGYLVGFAGQLIAYSMM